MAIYTRAVRWDSPPPIISDIDHNHPIMAGIGGFFDARQGIELVYGNRASALTTTRAISKAGIAADFSSTANQQYAHRPGYASTGAMTIFIVAEIRALSNYTAVIAKQGATTTNAPYELRLGSASTDGKVQILRATASSYSGSTHSSNLVSASAGAIQKLAFTVSDGDIGTRFQYMINGGALATFPSSITGSTGPCTDNGAAVWIGRRYDGATQLDGKIYYVALWNRMLSELELRLLNANPWMVYAP